MLACKVWFVSGAQFIATGHSAVGHQQMLPCIFVPVACLAACLQDGVKISSRGRASSGHHGAAAKYHRKLSIYGPSRDAIQRWFLKLADEVWLSM